MKCNMLIVFSWLIAEIQLLVDAPWLLDECLKPIRVSGCFYAGCPHRTALHIVRCSMQPLGTPPSLRVIYGRNVV